MRILRFSLVLIGILVLLVAGCAKEEGGEQAGAQQGGAGSGSQAAPGDPTVAVVVDGTEITNGQIDQEIDRMVKQMGGQISPQQLESMKGMLKQQAMDNAINRVLLEEAINKEGIEATQAEIDERMAQIASQFGSDEEMDERLAMMGMTRESLTGEMRTAIEVEKLLAKQSGSTEVTDAQIREYYDSNPDQFKQPERIKASHILFGLEDGATPEARAEKKAEAERVLAELKQGGNFEELASQYSTCPSASRGGDLGFFERGRMVKPFEDAAFALGVGEISDVVETRFGFHIIKVVDHEDARTIPFDEAKENIRGFLESRGKQDALKNYTEQLRAEADIEYKNAPEADAPDMGSPQ
ncbi:MAG: peptidylprolyl isomerase [bacterium]